MNYLESDLDAMLDTLDSVEVAYQGTHTRGFLNDEQAEERVRGYPTDNATRQVSQWSLMIRRGSLPALEALDRAGAELTIAGAPYRVLDMMRLDDGRVLRIPVAPL